MVRSIRVPLYLSCMIITAGCANSSQPGYLHAEIAVGEKKEWVSCSSGGNCRFAGEGMNEGPDCAEDLVGTISFVDSLGTPIYDAINRSLFSFEWRVDPNPSATIHPGETFRYVTATRVPKLVIAQVASFDANTQYGQVRDCSL